MGGLWLQKVSRGDRSTAPITFRSLEGPQNPWIPRTESVGRLYLHIPQYGDELLFKNQRTGNKSLCPQTKAKNKHIQWTLICGLDIHKFNHLWFLNLVICGSTYTRWRLWPLRRLFWRLGKPHTTTHPPGLPWASEYRIREGIKMSLPVLSKNWK